MRYTTIIDVTEFAQVWQNPNVCRVYLFLCLKCGYHDQDRDFIKISTRVLAEKCGVTHAACRHALKVLLQAQLIAKAGDWWRIRKYVVESEITSRKQVEKINKQSAVDKAIEKARQAQQDALEKDLEARKQSRLGFLKYFEDLQRKAAQGDQEAAKIVEQRRPIYESYKKDFE